MLKQDLGLKWLLNGAIQFFLRLVVICHQTDTDMTIFGVAFYYTIEWENLAYRKVFGKNNCFLLMRVVERIGSKFYGLSKTYDVINTEEIRRIQWFLRLVNINMKKILFARYMHKEHSQTLLWTSNELKKFSKWNRTYIYGSW